MKTDLVVGGYIIHKGKVLLIHHKKLGIWLPVGGHIEKDETPDEAVAREVLEETGLRIRLLEHSDLPDTGNVKKSLALPFYVNVHSVGDHDHCCFFYVCEALEPAVINLDKNEVTDYGWFSDEEIKNSSKILIDVKNQALKALRYHNRRIND